MTWDGRPLNPERDGWHWVIGFWSGAKPQAAYWRREPGDWLCSGDSYAAEPEKMARGNRYIGPCAMPPIKPCPCGLNRPTPCDRETGCHLFAEPASAVPPEQVMCTALANRAQEIFNKQAAMGCSFRECLSAVYSVGVQAGAEVARDVTRTMIVNLERGAPEDVPAIVAWAKEQIDV